jgi:hypothetical protein
MIRFPLGLNGFGSDRVSEGLTSLDGGSAGTMSMIIGGPCSEMAGVVDLGSPRVL